MFISNGSWRREILVNLSRARTIKQVKEVKQAGRRDRFEYVVDFDNGHRELIEATADDIFIATGTLVPAPPGMIVHRLWYHEEPDASGARVWTQTLAVIAWLKRPDWDSLQPLTVDGFLDEDNKMIWVVQHPDGKVEHLEDRTFDSLQDAVADFTDQCDARAPAKATAAAEAEPAAEPAE